MLVLPPRAIPQLAERIEQAYLRRRPSLYREYVDSRVWPAVAAVLVALHRSDPSLPIDPELYVACQLGAPSTRRPDPWGELINPSAPTRYRRQIRRIIGALRRELRSELRFIDRRRQSGIPIEQILDDPSPRISPLGRFIAAHRELGPEAAAAYREAVRRQHDACPLYRQACARLLPEDAYPVHDVLTDFAPGYASASSVLLN